LIVITDGVTGYVQQISSYIKRKKFALRSVDVCRSLLWWKWPT